MTNVLLDLVTDDQRWADWSIAQLEAASLDGPHFFIGAYGAVSQLPVLTRDVGRYSAAYGHGGPRKNS